MNRPQAMADLDPTQPFVLLDDASPGGTARLFDRASGTIAADTPAEVRLALDALRRRPGHRAGFVAFEAGYAIEPALAARARSGGDGLPLLWFGTFDRAQMVDVDPLLDAGPARVGPLVPDLDETAHAAMIVRIAALIASGDIYQANLTFSASVEVSGHPLALYRRLRRAQAAPFGALVHTGAAWLLSFSPELFFALDGRRLTARPMKGTAARGLTAAGDDAAALALAADPKNRAENLMIVDLIRNDLARVAVPGSVAVPDLFAVERYPTLLQMTSTVTAAARPEIGAVETLEALFPCGSITGAPKIRAMQVIADVEAGPRGVYTGSIGWIGADGDAAFNVAIRTLVMTAPGRATIGLGSGIVADSVAAEEWRESLAKAAFLARGDTPDIIETMRCEAGAIPLLDRHLARAAATARFLGSIFDATAISAAVVEATAARTARIRLLVSPAGEIAIHATPLPAAPPGPVDVAVVPLPVAAGDWRLRHKTTDRGFYDAARAAAGSFEVVFARSDGRLTEGSFTSLFVPRADGILLTPPLAAGLLPGILRAELLAAGRAVEAELTVDDLASGFFVGNAVRGLLPARCVQDWHDAAKSIGIDLHPTTAGLR